MKLLLRYSNFNLRYVTFPNTGLIINSQLDLPKKICILPMMKFGVQNLKRLCRYLWTTIEYRVPVKDCIITYLIAKSYFNL